MRLETFENELRYRAGKDQPVADCLSRNPIEEEIDLDDDGVPTSAAYLVTSTHRTIDGEIELKCYTAAVDDEFEADESPEEMSEEEQLNAEEHQHP
mmetsp:Transcript_30978/g.99946  ORF Transcript_30978/g.99946 Transcript_30978/m.99946 type:complete len:96 (-) Transcript_30978:12-299(-)